jgi:hypothetical protein
MLLGVFAKLWKATAPLSCLPIHMYQLGLH